MIDLVVEPPHDRLQETTLAAMATLAAPERVRRIEAPEGTYDLVFSDEIAAGRHLRPGGVLCRFLGRKADAMPAGLTPVGRWRAYPDWPAFRVLIPDNPAGWRAAARDLRLFPSRSATGLRARLSPGAAARLLPEHGIALYRRDGGESHPTLLAALRGALASIGDDAIRSTPPERWLLASGRLGPGNPILAFSLDEDGRPKRLIKTARFPGGQHLYAEAEQLDRIERSLGPAEAARVIRPTDSAVVAGRWALAYNYEPTHPFFGIRWRLRAARDFVSPWPTGWRRSDSRPDSGPSGRPSRPATLPPCSAWLRAASCPVASSTAPRLHWMTCSGSRRLSRWSSSTAISVSTTRV